MKKYAQNLFLAVVAMCALGTQPARAAQLPDDGTFFSNKTYVGSDDGGNPVYYLDYFNYFTFDEFNTAYVYKYNFGWLYFYGGSGPSGNNDAYFYDFIEDDVFYTAPELYPYFYSFNLDNFIYYFEDSIPRTFYDFDTDEYISY